MDKTDETTTQAVEYTLSGTLQYLSQFTVDAIIFAVILIFAIVFEKGVLAARRRAV